MALAKQPGSFKRMLDDTRVAVQYLLDALRSSGGGDDDSVCARSGPVLVEAIVPNGQYKGTRMVRVRRKPPATDGFPPNAPTKRATEDMNAVAAKPPGLWEVMPHKLRRDGPEHGEHAQASGQSDQGPG